MSSRYFAKVKELAGDQVREAVYPLGLYRTPEEAKDAAQLRLARPGVEILGVSREGPWHGLIHRATRVLIRTLRVAVAVAIALLAYAWLSDAIPDMGDIPVGQLTGRMISDAVLYTLLGLAIGAFCWWLAFGSGPQDSAFDQVNH